MQINFPSDWEESFINTKLPHGPSVRKRIWTGQGKALTFLSLTALSPRNNKKVLPQMRQYFFCYIRVCGAVLYVETFFVKKFPHLQKTSKIGIAEFYKAKVAGQRPAAPLVPCPQKALKMN